MNEQNAATEPGATADAGAQAPALDGLHEQLATARRELDESRHLLERAIADRDTARAVFDAGAIDLDAAAALVEKIVAQEAGLSVTDAVSRLKQSKPMLFRARTRGRADGRWSPPAGTAEGQRAGASHGRGAMAARFEPDAGRQLAEVAREARESGDRGALLAYLRLRREAV